MAAIAGVALIGAFVLSPAGPGLGHRILASVPGMGAAAAPFEGGFPPGLAADWRSGLLDGAIEAGARAHADRVIMDLAIVIVRHPAPQHNVPARRGLGLDPFPPLRAQLPP